MANTAPVKRDIGPDRTIMCMDAPGSGNLGANLSPAAPSGASKILRIQGHKRGISMPVRRPISLFSWLLTLLLPVAALGGPLGVFEDHADVGKPKLAGQATWNAASQEYVITAGGVN